jgi:YggT family protein
VGVNAIFVLLADAIDSAQLFIEVFASVYGLLILIYIILSWVRLPYSLWLNRIQQFLRDVVEPYLGLFRRILPPLGPLDLSPIVAIFVLFLVERLVVGLLGRFH